MPGQGNHEEKCRVPGAQGCKANIPCSGLPEQGISGKRCLVGLIGMRLIPELACISHDLRRMRKVLVCVLMIYLLLFSL